MMSIGLFASKIRVIFEAKQKISEKSYQQFADCVFLQRQKLIEENIKGFALFIGSLM